MPWKVFVCDFETMHGLIYANVHKGSLGINFPSGRIWKLCVIRLLAIGHLNDIFRWKMSPCLGDALGAPEASREIHGLFIGFQTNQVLEDGGVLQGSSSLIEHDGEVIGDIQKSSYLRFTHVGDLDELRLSVTELHHTLVGTAVVDDALGSSFQDGSWQDAGSWRKVVGQLVASNFLGQVAKIFVVFVAHDELI